MRSCAAVVQPRVVEIFESMLKHLISRRREMELGQTSLHAEVLESQETGSNVLEQVTKKLVGKLSKTSIYLSAREVAHCSDKLA